ncbi:MAG: hypothetical protein HY401_02810 [Elusimicrobia bacterium]|nr:hypothetical protein [Elusimicrobiota bacterium]
MRQRGVSSFFFAFGILLHFLLSHPASAVQNESLLKEVYGFEESTVKTFPSWLVSFLSDPDAMKGFDQELKKYEANAGEREGLDGLVSVIYNQIVTDGHKGYSRLKRFHDGLDLALKHLGQDQEGSVRERQRDKLLRWTEAIARIKDKKLGGSFDVVVLPKDFLDGLSDDKKQVFSDPKRGLRVISEALHGTSIKAHTQWRFVLPGEAAALSAKKGAKRGELAPSVIPAKNPGFAKGTAKGGGFSSFLKKLGRGLTVAARHAVSLGVILGFGALGGMAAIGWTKTYGPKYGALNGMLWALPVFLGLSYIPGVKDSKPARFLTGLPGKLNPISGPGPAASASPDAQVAAGRPSADQFFKNNKASLEKQHGTYARYRQLLRTYIDSQKEACRSAGNKAACQERTQKLAQLRNWIRDYMASVEESAKTLGLSEETKRFLIHGS